MVSIKNKPYIVVNFPHTLVVTPHFRTDNLLRLGIVTLNAQVYILIVIENPDGRLLVHGFAHVRLALYEPLRCLSFLPDRLAQSAVYLRLMIFFSGILALR